MDSSPQLRHSRSRFVLVVIAAMLIVVIAVVAGSTGIALAADGDGGPDTTTTTAASDTTTSPDDGASDEPIERAPWWLLILVVVAVVLIVIALASGRRPKPVPVATVSWKDHARMGYAEARWMNDTLTEDLAVWRGNALVDDTTAVGSTAGTGLAESWAQLAGRMDRCRSHLYALEAAAPDPRSAQSARRAVETVTSLRAAVDARADARAGYRNAEDSGASPEQLIEARDREIRTSTNLHRDREAAATALRDLSTLL
ncbi:MAG: hypothetical protein KDB69_08555 [Acidimicrobiia bacterium]|nr:hypothetical protein [Acidimicrobiia bacterium]